MASSYHVDLAVYQVPAQGAGNFTTLDSKVLSPKADQFILVVTPTGSNVKVVLEQSGTNLANSFSTVQDVQGDDISVTLTAGVTSLIYVDVPLLQYVRLKIGEATTTAYVDARLQFTLMK